MDLQFLNTQFVSPINAFNLRLMYARGLPLVVECFSSEPV